MTPLEAATEAARKVFDDQGSGFVSATWAETTAKAVLSAAIEALDPGQENIYFEPFGDAIPRAAIVRTFGLGGGAP